MSNRTGCRKFSRKKIKALHRAACENKQYYYTDPESGSTVLTALFLMERGSCCCSGCRHCPYGWDHTAKKHKIAGRIATQTTDMVETNEKNHKVMVILIGKQKLFLREENKTFKETYEALKHLNGKCVILQGLRSYNQFIVSNIKIRE